MIEILAGLVLSTCIGLLGYWRRSLSRGGVLGAVLTGTLVFGLGGFLPGLLLVMFFVSSSALSHYRARAKETLSDKFQKGARRDFGQALANGGWAAVLALAYGLSRADVFFAAFVGAIAAVTADTWATEIGVLSKTPPRLITTGRPVPVGASGGVTRQGTLTALAGATFIGGIISLAQSLFFAITPVFAAFSLEIVHTGIPLLDSIGLWPVLAGLSGLFGALFDSVLGATVQGIYYCDRDQKETERRVHSCGGTTRLVRGYAWLDNDVVNFLASVAGSVIAILIWAILR